MQAAKEYDLQFNNILKKEEYKKYVAAHLPLEAIHANNLFPIGLRSSSCGDWSMRRAISVPRRWTVTRSTAKNSRHWRHSPRGSKYKVLKIKDLSLNSFLPHKTRDWLINCRAREWNKQNKRETDQEPAGDLSWQASLGAHDSADQGPCHQHEAQESQRGSKEARTWENRERELRYGETSPFWVRWPTHWFPFSRWRLTPPL